MTGFTEKLIKIIKIQIKVNLLFKTFDKKFN